MITRDEIINMAQEAASPDTIDPHCDGWWTLTQEELERFFHAAYAAGAAAERERITQAAMLAAEKAVDAAIALEREACAKVCERDDSMRWSGAAAAIRARSAK